MMGFLIACIAIGTGGLAGLVAMQFEKRRADREIAEAAAESAVRHCRRAVVAEADRIVREAARREFQQQADAVQAIADAITMQAAFERNLLHADDLADRHPMPKRPAPPPPAPGEPWQLHLDAEGHGDE